MTPRRDGMRLVAGDVRLRRGTIVSVFLLIQEKTEAMASRGNSPPRTSPNADTRPLSADDALGRAIAECLARLAAGDPAARDRIVELVGDRLRSLAHRMLGRFPAVRRCQETDELVLLTNAHRPADGGPLAAEAEHRVDRVACEDEPLDRWSAFHGAIQSLDAPCREVFRMVWYAALRGRCNVASDDPADAR